MNVGLTLVGQISLPFIFYDETTHHGRSVHINSGIKILIISLPFLISVILLLLIQILDHRKTGCCSKLTERTLLNVENIFEIIYFKELQQSKENQAVEPISARKLEISDYM